MSLSDTLQSIAGFGTLAETLSKGGAVKVEVRIAPRTLIVIGLIAAGVVAFIVTR